MIMINSFSSLLKKYLKLVKSSEYWNKNIQNYLTQSLKSEHDLYSLYKYHSIDNIIILSFNLDGCDNTYSSLYTLINNIKDIYNNVYMKEDNKLYLLYLLSNIFKLYNYVSDEYKNCIKDLCKTVLPNVIDYCKMMISSNIKENKQNYILLSPYYFIPLIQSYQIIKNELNVPNELIKCLIVILNQIISQNKLQYVFLLYLDK